MFTLEDCEILFMLTSLLGAFIILSPALVLILPSQTGEKFSELYILDSNHMAENYPHNVVSSENYKIYLGIGNHMGSSAYYVLYVKLRNQTESLPNSTDGTPSSLSAIYEYRTLLVKNEVWEVPLNFSFRDISFYGNKCIVGILTLNGLDLQVYKSILWNQENKGYFFEIFFELWIYNPESSGFSFHNRFVGLWLNMTV